MAKHVVDVMDPETFALRVGLNSLKGLFRPKDHPLREIHRLLKEYKTYERWKFDERYAALRKIIDLCNRYVALKPASKQAVSGKVGTVRRLAMEAALVTAMETERARQLEAQFAPTPRLASVGATLGHKKPGLRYERIFEEGEWAMHGEDLLAFAKEKYKFDVDPKDPGKTFYGIKKIVKDFLSNPVQLKAAKEFFGGLNLIYMNAEQRAEWQLLVWNDAFYLGDKKVNTFKGSQRSPWLYAMSPEGALFAHPPQHSREKGTIHHSSFLAGKDALCAGEIMIADGRLIEISNESGHYATRLIHLASACAAILEVYDPKNDGYALFVDYANEFKGMIGVHRQQQQQEKQEVRAYRIPLREFVAKIGKPKNPEDFEVMPGGGATPWKYARPEAAKKRGCVESTV